MFRQNQHHLIGASVTWNTLEGKPANLQRVKHAGTLQKLTEDGYLALVTKDDGTQHVVDFCELTQVGKEDIELLSIDQNLGA